MATPNIVGVSDIRGNTVYLIPSTTSPTVWTGLTPATNVVNKVGNITATNVTASAVAVTVSINSATAGGGTAYRLCYQIAIPANASLIIVDKTTGFYVNDAQSVVVTSGVANALEFVATYEAIT
jgi:predicted membrane protein